MLLPRLSALLMAASAVNALKDAHPFLLLASDSTASSHLQSRQIATASDVEEQAHQYLSACDRNRYVVLTQPGLKAADFQHMPKLRQRVEGLSDAAYLQIPDVIGGVSTKTIADGLTGKCEVKDSPTRHLVTRPLVPLFADMEDRQRQIERTDEAIDRTLAELGASGEPWVVIYAGTQWQGKVPVEDHQDPPYEMDEPYPSSLHTDLKRDTEMHKRQMRARASNATDNPHSNLPLFEKYQFLSPPLFMGLSVSIVLFLILYVGVTAIAGLEVSYQAFSKEMGPQAQNKGKQQ